MSRGTMMSLVVLFLAIKVGFADIRVDHVPRTSKDNRIAVQVVMDRNAKESRIEVPAEMFSALSGSGSEFVAATDRPLVASTVVPGAALACGLLFGGLWLVRRTGKSQQRLLIAAGLCLIFAAGSYVFADLRPPFGPPPGNRPVPRAKPADATSVVLNLKDVKVSNSAGKSVRLVLTSEQLTALMGGAPQR